MNYRTVRRMIDPYATLRRLSLMDLNWTRAAKGFHPQADHAYIDDPGIELKSLDSYVMSMMGHVDPPGSLLVPAVYNYLPGDFQIEHYDSEYWAMSSILMLKNADSGGDLIIENDQVSLEPGELIIFSPMMNHSVTPIVKGSRVTMVRFVAKPEYLKQSNENVKKSRDRAVTQNIRKPEAYSPLRF